MGWGFSEDGSAIRAIGPMLKGLSFSPLDRSLPFPFAFYSPLYFAYLYCGKPVATIQLNFRIPEDSPYEPYISACLPSSIWCYCPYHRVLWLNLWGAKS